MWIFVHFLVGLSAGVSGVGAELQMRMRRKAARMLVAVVIMFALFYLPVHLISIVRCGRLLLSFIRIFN